MACILEPGREHPCRELRGWQGYAMEGKLEGRLGMCKRNATIMYREVILV